jgi:hypothetical protein
MMQGVLENLILTKLSLVYLLTFIISLIFVLYVHCLHKRYTFTKMDFSILLAFFNIIIFLIVYNILRLVYLTEMNRLLLVVVSFIISYIYMLALYCIIKLIFKK